MMTMTTNSSTACYRLVVSAALLLSFAVLPTTVVAKETCYQISNPSCDSPWTLTDFSSSGSDCSASAVLTVSDGGEFYDEDIDIKYYVMGFNVGTTQGNVCDLVSGDNDCGQAGVYTIDESMFTHDAQQAGSSSTVFTTVLTYMSPTVTVDFGGIATCRATVSSSSSSSSQSMSMVAVSAIVGTLLVGAVLYGVRRKRRRVVQGEESLQRTLTDFEMSPDIRSVRV